MNVTLIITMSFVFISYLTMGAEGDVPLNKWRACIAKYFFRVIYLAIIICIHIYEYLIAYNSDLEFRQMQLKKINTKIN